MTIRQRKGFSLIELMIAIVVMAVVLAGTMNFFMGQSRTFRKATTDMVLLQNARFATDMLNEHFRSVGANLTVGQPAVIYADQNTFAFNADYATNVAGDIDAIYYEPKAPTNETQALLKAQAFTIPQSSPALSYPGGDWITGAGVPSPAEAITFWFAPDTETTRSDDYVLLRQVNSSAPEVVVRRFGVLASGDRSGPVTVRAATVGGAAGAVGLVLDRHVLAAVNGDATSRDPHVPLVAGDVVAFLSADAGG